MIPKLKYLIKSVWRRAKGYFLISFFQNSMAAAIPLIDILGIGMVVDKLSSGAAKNEIISEVKNGATRAGAENVSGNVNNREKKGVTFPSINRFAAREIITLMIQMDIAALYLPRSISFALSFN